MKLWSTIKAGMAVRLEAPRLFTKADLLGRKRYVIASATSLYAVFVALEFAHTKGSSPLDFLPSLILALAPILLYVAVRSPLVFPYCAYVLILPFESLSLIGGAGTLAKFIAIACALTILLDVIMKKTWVQAPRALTAWVVLFAWMLVTDFWAFDQTDAWTALPTYASLIALYAVISIKRPSKFEFQAMLTAIVGAGIVSAGYAAVLFHGGGSVVLKSASRVMLVVGDSRIDPNAWAASLVLPIALTLNLLFNARSGLVRLAMVPAIAILFAGLAASGSRGGTLAVLTVFALLCARSRHRRWLFSTLVASVTLALIANPGLIARFQAAQTDGGAGRTDIWRIGLHALRNHWLFGAGVGNFSSAFDEEYLHVFTKSLLRWHMSPHNVPLEIATELGIIGFGLWGAVLYYQMATLRVIDKRHKLYELRLALEGAYLGGIVSSLSGANFAAKYIWLTYFTMLITRGYVIAGRRRAAFEAGPRSSPSMRSANAALMPTVRS